MSGRDPEIAKNLEFLCCPLPLFLSSCPLDSRIRDLVHPIGLRPSLIDAGVLLCISCHSPSSICLLGDEGRLGTPFRWLVSTVILPHFLLVPQLVAQPVTPQFVATVRHRKPRENDATAEGVAAIIFQNHPCVEISGSEWKTW